MRPFKWKPFNDYDIGTWTGGNIQRINHLNDDLTAAEMSDLQAGPWQVTVDPTVTGFVNVVVLVGDPRDTNPWV